MGVIVSCNGKTGLILGTAVGGMPKRKKNWDEKVQVVFWKSRKRGSCEDSGIRGEKLQSLPS